MHTMRSTLCVPLSIRHRQYRRCWVNPVTQGVWTDVVDLSVAGFPTCLGAFQ